ncbi:MAG: SusC/RagA family TonB-linked outer membrane protein, partial [Butyricimonas paravirosa]
RYSVTTRAEYIQNLSTLVKGLELRASIALNKEGYYVNAYKTIPFMYRLEGYNFETGEHKLQSVKSDARRTLTKSNEASTSTQATQVSYEVRALHSAAWKDHQTSLTGVFSAQETTTSATSTVLDGILNET